MRDGKNDPALRLLIIIMEKHKIVVPKGIRYIGERDEEGKLIWGDYNIWNYGFPHILNKTLTGCGFTEYCLKCPYPIILVSPRKFLLQNKRDQHLGEVYYFQNDNEVSVDYELDVEKDDVKAIREKAETIKEGEEETITNLDNLKSSFRSVIKTHRMCTPFKPIKILVTYDSFKHVKDCLQHLYYDEFNHSSGYENILDRFQVVVDEFQSIFINARFKSDTEIELLEHLKGIDRVCFVSATPMLDRYLEMLDEFKDLPYYEMDWKTEDPGRVEEPDLTVKFTTRSLNDEAKGIVDSYKKGKYETRLDPRTGNLIESKEAVIFMNSVKGICQVIRTNRLHINQVNVICAQTSKNRDAVAKAFNDVLRKEIEDTGREMSRYPKIPKDYDVIGQIPLIGQPHKMFTLCTRTVYLGADFYSTNARTFIFSNSNISCLSVDIGTDLEQILGRQRLKENPWKNSATMFIKTTSKKHLLKKEDFDKELERKDKKTENLLNAYEVVTSDTIKFDLAEKYQKDAKVSHYRDDYVSVTEIRNWSTGQVVKLVPKYNKLMKVSDIRAFEIQQIDYKDRISVFSALGKKGIEGATERACELATEFNSTGDTVKRLRMLVELPRLEGITEKDISSFLDLIPIKFKEYYVIIGPEFIKKHSYREIDIRREWKKIKLNEEKKGDIEEEIRKVFEVGKRYTKSEIKKNLNKLYERVGYKQKAKATDLDKYFTIKEVKFQDSTGKWVNGFEVR